MAYYIYLCGSLNTCTNRSLSGGWMMIAAIKEGELVIVTVKC